MGKPLEDSLDLEERVVAWILRVVGFCEKIVAILFFHIIIDCNVMFIYVVYCIYSIYEDTIYIDFLIYS